MSDAIPPPFNLWTYIVEHLASIIAAIGSVVSLFWLKTIKIELNSRLTEMLKLNTRADRAEAKAEGREAEHQRRKGNIKDKETDP